MASLTRLAGVNVAAVKGLGGKRAETLAKVGIRNVADLLHHVPHRYLDRSRHTKIASAPIGEEVTLFGEVMSLSTRRPRRNLMIIEAIISDESGSMSAVWFNQKFRIGQLSAGTQVAVSGMVNRYNRGLQMKSPDVDVLDTSLESLVTGRVVPIHSVVKGIRPGDMRRAMHNALLRSRPIDDPIPKRLIEGYQFIGRDQAFADIHFPETLEQVGPARNRLVYDELFRLELALALRKRQQTLEASGIAHTPTGELVDRFLGGFPYELTSAQTKALAEIQIDLRRPHPMHRLLQGEVGSGKTVVAVAAMLSVIESGYQTAIMAPTEVLAEQHFLGVVDLLSQAGLSPDIRGLGSELGMESLFAGHGPGVHMALLTGSTAVTNYRSPISRTQLLDDVRSGQIDLLVGTHALIQEGVEFDHLGAAVVDEQHRFGVAQRVRLKEKAGEEEPDLLIMTATPIPRTITMTIYGDLDVSNINEMPPGRTPTETKLVAPSAEDSAWLLIRKHVALGRQAFVVCPLVEESTKIEASSATAEYERISALMPDLRVGLIHGQLKSAEKEQSMTTFRDGDFDVLVATTVIEVGIDVPNATVMVIEDADRFGLSQLHQLRGRVGRGEHRGICVLLADPKTDEGKRRLAAMISTTDGFSLANTDLRIRGQGTVFGTRQSGLADLKLADVLDDYDVLVQAREDAFALVDADPDLEKHPELADEVRAMLGDRADWLVVG